MILAPLNVSAITAAVRDRLSADVRLKAARIERGAEINKDPALCPWVGIYRASVQYPSRTLGLGQGYRGQRVQLVLLTQHADWASGEACEEALEALNVDVLSVLLSDPRLGGVVDGLDEIEVQYPDYQRTQSGQYIQTSAIYITALGGIQVT